jgi:4-phytase/acid phosphatase
MMIRRLMIVCAALTATAWAANAAPMAAPVLERVVILERHGVRPPIPSNEALARYADQPWPAWPVAPGELTPHGGETVRLVGRTLRQAYVDGHLLPAQGCPDAAALTVWADGADQRTRRSGDVLAEALAPGCGVKATSAPPSPRDPIFNGQRDAIACRSEPEAANRALLAAVGAGGVDTPASRSALRRLQAVLAPSACHGGKGMCFAGDDRIVTGPTGPRLEGPLTTAPSLAEDLLLEYAEGMPAEQVGWGRAGSADAIAAVMPLHERSFRIYARDRYQVGRDGAPMARLILAALSGQTRAAAPAFGPQTRVFALAGHDTNLVLMGGLFGLEWTLPGEPDSTAPATALAFELWTRGGQRYVRPVVWYETLDQLRALKPETARRLDLTFTGCRSGPMGSCPLETLRRRAQALIPPGCGEV